MNIIEKATVQAFHRDRIGSSPPKVMGYRDIDSQVKRFESLCRWADMSGSSVLDLGCGYGEFKPFLDERFSDVTYLGIDFLDEFIQVAKKRFGKLDNTFFLKADFHTAVFPKVDFIVASGSLNYRSTNPEHPWNVIEKMWLSAEKGVAFNLLDKNSFEDDAILCGYDQTDVFEYCKQMSSNVKLFDGYLSDDFTIFMPLNTARPSDDT